MKSNKTKQGTINKLLNQRCQCGTKPSWTVETIADRIQLKCDNCKLTLPISQNTIELIINEKEIKTGD